jgi:hypothetical protein
MEPSGNEEERKTKEFLEKIGYQSSGKGRNELRILAANRSGKNS